MTEDELLALIERAGLAEVMPELRTHFRRSIRLAAERMPDESIPIGTSKFGGAPDLLLGTHWPQSNGRALAFIAQLRLSDLAPLDGDHLLPQTGLLSFFYDADTQPWGCGPSSSGGCKVRYQADALATLHRAVPSSLNPPGVFDSCALYATQDVTIPPFRSLLLGEMELDEQQIEAYLRLEHDLILNARGGERVPVHRVLGHPDAIQNDMQLECEMQTRGLNPVSPDDWARAAAALKDDLARWHLLLQVDTDDAPGWMWGDAGRIYFWIEASALRAHDFDQSWMILQCY